MALSLKGNCQKDARSAGAGKYFVEDKQNHPEVRRLKYGSGRGGINMTDEGNDTSGIEPL